MVAAAPSTILVNGSAVAQPGVTCRIKVPSTGVAAAVYTDASGDALIAGAIIANSAGDISPTASPLLMDPGSYTVEYTDLAGVARTLTLTVTGTARPSPNAPATQEAGQATFAGPNVFAAGAVGLNGNTPVGKATAVAAASSTGVVNPANAVYTVADQTALAASVQGLVTSVNAIRAALTAIGITG